MIRDLFLDFETRSQVNLKKCGAYIYASHPTTEILCCACNEGDSNPTRVLFGKDLAFLVYLVLDAQTLHSHNFSFERLILREKLGIHIPINQWSCTAAKAAAMGLPRSLEGAGAALGLKIQKDPEGKKNMLKLCKTLPGQVLDEEDLHKLYDYCIRDVDAEMALDAALPDLTSTERAIWELDAKMNDIGIPLDIKGVLDLMQLVGEQEFDLEARLSKLTFGVIDSGGQRDRILQFLQAYGLDLPDLTEATVKEYLRKNLTPVAREVLEIRKELARGSCAKLEAMRDCAGPDNRVRGSLLYHGTETGRWAGRLLQPHNMPRGHRKINEVEEALFDAGMADKKAFLAQYDSILPVASDCLRGLICAPEGWEFLTADYSNIEGRLNAHLAGEEWKLQAFREFDLGTGPDLYNLAYAKSFGVSLDNVGEAQRQVGKVQELALGYQGGPSAYYKMAENYGVQVPPEERDQSYTAAKLRLTQEEKDREPTEEEIFHAWARPIVSGWREQNPAIVKSWSELEVAAYNTVRLGKPHGYRAALFGMSSKGVLRLRLPSGRMLSYHGPQIQDCKTPWDKVRSVVTVMGEDSLTHKWVRSPMYGGKWCNALVQGSARDIMADAMLRLDSAGFKVILTVHDEIVVEVKEGEKRDEEFKRIILTMPQWATGMPMAIKTWRGRRYRK